MLQDLIVPWLCFSLKTFVRGIEMLPKNIHNNTVNVLKLWTQVADQKGMNKQHRGWRAAGSSLTSVTALCPWARHIIPSLVLFQPRKTRPFITERLLIGRKESNQTKQTNIADPAVWSRSSVCFSAEHFLKSSPDNWHFMCEQKRESVWNFRTFTLLLLSEW